MSRSDDTSMPVSTDIPTDTLSVLVLEDSRIDAEAMIHQLREDGFQVEWRRVDTEADYLSALRPDLDLILADYSLPGFDALGALRLLQERGLDVPFIIVTGVLRDGDVARCLRQGAADFLQKDRLGRLGDATRSALEWRSTHRTLRAREERFRAMFEQSVVGIMVASPEGILIEINDAMCGILGYTREELLGRSPDEITHPDDVDHTRKSVTYEAIAEGGGQDLERRYIRKDDRVVWARVRVVPLKEDGRSVLAMVEDITESKRGMDALRQSEARFRGVFDSAPTGIVLADAQSRIVQANAASAGMFGYPGDELRALSIQDLTHPDDFEESHRALRYVSEGLRDRVEMQTRYVRKDGHIVWGDTLLTTIRDEDGVLQYVMALIEDLTERRDAEEQIVELHLQLGASRGEHAEVGISVARNGAGLEVRMDDAGHTLVGHSALMQSVFDHVHIASDSAAPVFLSGETGTGKDLLARIIHLSGPRRGGPYLALNCAALAESMVEAELFGHERGAFTGAMTLQRGNLELAQGGTLLLNEIAEMPSVLQAKLLQVVETGEFMRIGGSTHIAMDCRLISATNVDIEEAVRGGKLRRDLYYRLNAIRIHLPPLRARREDIPPLVAHFLESVGCRESVSAEAMGRLVELPWEGNVRQLRHAVERATLYSQGEEIEFVDFGLSPEGSVQEDAVRAFEEWTGFLGERSDNASLLARAEDRLIESALLRAGGNRNEAGRLLGVDRHRIQRHLQRKCSGAATVPEDI